MLIDLLSSSNYISFNIKIAEVLGLHTAIYLAEVMNINDKAIRKDKVNGSYFSLDRNYLKSRTTLDVDEQLEIEEKLFSLGILNKSEGSTCTISLNISVLTTILMSPEENLVTDIAKLVKKKATKKTKNEAIIDNLKATITTTNNELRTAYEDWIESVYAKQGWMSKKSVLTAQPLIDEYTNRNLDMALKIISIAAINGYRDMQWAINSFEKDYNIKYKFDAKKEPPKRVELGNEVF